MIRVILFDLDDTLYSERDFVYGGFMNVSKYIGGKYDLPVSDIYSTTLDIFNNYGRGKIFNMLCEKYSLHEDIGKLIKIYRDDKPDIELYEDAKYSLNELKRDYKLGIITDGRNTVQWNKIKALDVKKYMDKIIVTDDHGEGYWKPSNKPYLDMIKYFGGQSREYIYIGDNPNKDFISAKKIGMSTIRIIRDIGDHMDVFLSEEYEADYTVRSLLEIKEVINLLNEKS